MTALRHRWLAVLVAVLTLAPLGGPGRALLFCHSMGRVMDACCCGSQRGVSAPEASVVVRAPSCCERLAAASPAAALAVRDAAAAPALAAVFGEPLALLGVVGGESREVTLAPVEARAPPPRGPPLFIENCALLI